ncbi:c-type cytochrome [Sphingomonas mali]|uniref:c-type cytochrome n=1 Tax=Sphingomonas mali TaxID=40682 RepID=UPI00082EECFC|nr:c-type cytochrome [Sphingomonas mali]
MQFKILALSTVVLVSSLSAALIRAAPPTSDPQVDITSPADRSRLPWQSQGSYAVTISYDGKSTRFDEIPSSDVLLATSFVPDTDAPAARRAAPLPQALADITRSNCMGCHDFNASSGGPSFAAIGKRYAGQPAAAATLAAHIRDGSRGAWGSGSMPPHPDLAPAQAGAIANWILTHGTDPAVRYYVGKSGSFRMITPGKPGPRAGLVLSAYYTGPLTSGGTRNAVGRNVVVVMGTGS